MNASSKCTCGHRDCPVCLPRAPHAKVMRQLEEDPILKHHVGFILKMAAFRAVKCRCGKLSCPMCGMAKFMARVRRIETNPNIRSAMLSGGIQ